MSQKILLLDVDGVLNGPDFIRWKEGISTFFQWADQQFDLVCMLSGWQGQIHKVLQGWGRDYPSLAWKTFKYEGLQYFLDKGWSMWWVEDGVLEKERQWCKEHQVRLIEVAPDLPLAVIQHLIIFSLLTSDEGDDMFYYKYS